MSQGAYRNHGYQIVVENRNGSFKPVELGQGVYAHVYLAKADLRLGSSQPEIEVRVAAKLCNDEAESDFEDLFGHEVEHLRSLGSHDHIVGLRGVDAKYPPTFLCQGCGAVYHCIECPEGGCGQPLENGPYDKGNPTLVCTAQRSHIFRKTNEEDVRKLAAQHSCSARQGAKPAVVRFLFRPCIFLDVLDLNVYELQSALASGKPTRNHEVKKTTEQEDEWKRQKALMYIWVLSQAAEGLAYTHKKGKLHGDISPQNIMVTLDKPPYQYRFGAYPIHNTCLIDLGEARTISDLNLSRPPRFQRHFVAPERGVESKLPGPVSILPREGEFKKYSLCTLTAPPEVALDLAENDIVDDGQAGLYQVVRRLAEQDGQANFELRVINVPNLTQSAAETQFQLTMVATAGIAADIFSLGSVAGWLCTDGRVPILKSMQTAASAATDRMKAVDDSFLETFLPQEERDRLLRALVLPEDSNDLRLRERLLLIIMRCLVRAKGAYSETRDSPNTEAAVRLVQDLRALFDDLYFLHCSRSRKLDWLSQGKRSYENLELQIDSVRKEAELALTSARKDVEIKQAALESQRKTQTRLLRLLVGAALGVGLLAGAALGLQIPRRGPVTIPSPGPALPPVTPPAAKAQEIVPPGAVPPTAEAHVPDPVPAAAPPPPATGAAAPLPPPAAPPAHPTAAGANATPANALACPNMALASGGDVLYAATGDAEVQAWNLRDLGREAAQFKASSIAVPSGTTVLAVSPDGKWLFAGGKSGRLLKVVGTPPVEEVEIAVSAVTGALFSPDGNHLAISSSGGKIQVWNLSTKSFWPCKIAATNGGIRSVSGMAFPESGKYLDLIDDVNRHRFSINKCTHEVVAHKTKTPLAVSSRIIIGGNRALFLDSLKEADFSADLIDALHGGLCKNLSAMHIYDKFVLVGSANNRFCGIAWIGETEGSPSWQLNPFEKSPPKAPLVCASFAANRKRLALLLQDGSIELRHGTNFGKINRLK